MYATPETQPNCTQKYIDLSPYVFEFLFHLKNIS